MRTINLTTFFAILALTSANIWDSLFSETTSPFMKIPDDFSMSLASTSLLLPYDLKLNYSGTFNKISINGEAELFGQSTSLGQAILDFNGGSVIFHSPYENCIMASTPNYNLHMDLSKVKFLWDFASNYVNTTEDQLDMYNVSGIFRMFNVSNNIYFFFDVNHTLDLIEIETQNQNIMLNVNDFSEQNFTADDFEAPTSWNCTGDSMLTMQDLKSQGFLKEIIANILDHAPVPPTHNRMLSYRQPNYDHPLSYYIH